MVLLSRFLFVAVPALSLHVKLRKDDPLQTVPADGDGQATHLPQPEVGDADFVADDGQGSAPAPAVVPAPEGPHPGDEFGTEWHMENVTCAGWLWNSCGHGEYCSHNDISDVNECVAQLQPGDFCGDLPPEMDAVACADQPHAFELVHPGTYPVVGELLGGAPVQHMSCQAEPGPMEAPAPHEVDTPEVAGSAPAGSAPAGSAPVEAGSAPVEAGSAPVEAGSAPVEAGSAPVVAGSAPAEAGSAPAEAGSAPAFIQKKKRQEPHPYMTCQPCGMPGQAECPHDWSHEPVVHVFPEDPVVCVHGLKGEEVECPNGQTVVLEEDTHSCADVHEVPGFAGRALTTEEAEELHHRLEELAQQKTGVCPSGAPGGPAVPATPAAPAADEPAAAPAAAPAKKAAAPAPVAEPAAEPAAAPAKKGPAGDKKAPGPKVEGTVARPEVPPAPEATGAEKTAAKNQLMEPVFLHQKNKVEKK